jgi:hypothetical protein
MQSRKAGKRGPKAGYIEKLEARIKLLESLLTSEQWNHLDMSASTEGSPAAISSYFPQKVQTISHQDLRFDLIALYFKYDHNKFPFLHEDSFMQNMGGRRTCLLYAIYALGAMNQSDGDANNFAKAGSLYYELAVKEVNQMSVDVADYHLIGACLLLMFYKLGNLISSFAIGNSSGFECLTFSSGGFSCWCNVLLSRL